MDFTIFTAIFDIYITDLDVNVDKLPNHLKLCVLYSTRFYHRTVVNELRFIILQSLLRFQYYPKKSHLQHAC
jgi:hypothetical protein